MKSKSLILSLLIVGVLVGLTIMVSAQNNWKVAQNQEIFPLVSAGAPCSGACDHCLCGGSASGNDKDGCTCDCNPSPCEEPGGLFETSIYKKIAETRSNKPLSTPDTSTRARKSQVSECPRRWTTLLAKDDGNCCRKAENMRRSIPFLNRA